jgi:hypothetical protein
VACVAAVDEAKQQLNPQQVPSTNQGNGGKQLQHRKHVLLQLLLLLHFSPKSSKVLWIWHK